jgi:uncharacterized protein (DUF2141 family)
LAFDAIADKLPEFVGRDCVKRNALACKILRAASGAIQRALHSPAMSRSLTALSAFVLVAALLYGGAIHIARARQPTTGPATTQPGVAVTFVCDSLRDRKGQMLLVVFDSPDGWPGDDDDSKAIRHLVAHLDGKGEGTISTMATTLPAGTYAASVLHDENNNGEMDTGFLGVPLEGYGFTNNPKVMFERPKFDQCVFEVKPEGPMEIRIKIQYWGK